MYFGKPIVYVERYKYMWERMINSVANIPYKPRTFAPTKKTGSLSVLGTSPTIEELVSKLPNASVERRDAQAHIRTGNVSLNLKYIGAEIELKKLQSKLLDAAFTEEIARHDLQELEGIQSSYFFKLDGQAFTRIADEIEDLGAETAQWRQTYFKKVSMIFRYLAYSAKVDLKRLVKSVFGRRKY